MAPQMDGRVFSRLQQFAALHGDFQEEVKELEVYLTANKNDIFGLHHANLVKSIRSIRAKPLVEKIDAWLQNKNAPVAAAATATTTAAEPESVPVPAPATEQVTPAATTEEVTPAPTQEVTSEAPAATTETPAATTETAAAAATPTETPEELAAKAAAAAEASAARLAHAKKLLEALVLKGFVTPYKEQEKLPNFAAAASTAAAATAAADATSETTESKPPAPLVFKDSELLIPVAPEVADDASVLTVWQLVDGAVYAGVLKRKAGFLAPLTQGKDVYAVINKRLKSLTLFETDVGRHPIVHFAVGEDEANAPTVHVSFDKAHFAHGIKVWNDVASELLNAANKLERETIVHALVGVGLQYREEPSINVDAIKSIYELKDVDIDGNDVTFDKYKGKVLLVVNVSSACGLTPINYPELVTLDEKYREMGLEVLAFPCNQFWGQEPGTHDEIKTFVQQYNANFTFFSKGDVNGTETRPVFAYLKAKQQGEGGDYIKWNFGKFLVDRNGQPVARYGPMEKPLSFESEIVKLLSAEADPEAVAVAEVDVKEVKTTTVVTETTTVETTTAVAAAVATEETLVGTEAIAAEDPVVVTETTTTTVVTETPTETTTVVTESPPVVVEEEKAAAAVAPQDTVVKTLSVEDQPLPVEETKPAPETKVEAEATPAASAAGEDAVSTTTTTSTTTSKTEETPEVVQGFTPGNEPVAAP